MNKLETTKPHPDPVIRVGVSSCLLGEEVRYDGGHTLERCLVNTQGRFFE